MKPYTANEIHSRFRSAFDSGPGREALAIICNWAHLNNNVPPGTSDRTPDFVEGRRSLAMDILHYSGVDLIEEIKDARFSNPFTDEPDAP